MNDKDIKVILLEELDDSLSVGENINITKIGNENKNISNILGKISKIDSDKSYDCIYFELDTDLTKNKCIIDYYNNCDKERILEDILLQ